MQQNFLRRHLPAGPAPQCGRMAHNAWVNCAQAALSRHCSAIRWSLFAVCSGDPTSETAVMLSIQPAIWRLLDVGLLRSLSSSPSHPPQYRGLLVHYRSCHVLCVCAEDLVWGYIDIAYPFPHNAYMGARRYSATCFPDNFRNFSDLMLDADSIQGSMTRSARRTLFGRAFFGRLEHDIDPGGSQAALG